MGIYTFKRVEFCQQPDVQALDKLEQIGGGQHMLPTPNLLVR